MDRVVQLEEDHRNLEAEHREDHEIIHGVTRDGQYHAGIVVRVGGMEWWFKVVAGLLSAILVLVASQMFMTLMKQSFGGDSNTNHTSISVDDPSNPTTVSPWYTTADIAELFGYSVREIQDRAAKGEIPGARKDGKAWRFDRAAVDAAIAAKASSAANAAREK